MQLNITPGQKGLVQLVGDVPSWINFQDREKVKASLSILIFDLMILTGVNLNVAAACFAEGTLLQKQARMLQCNCSRSWEQLYTVVCTYAMAQCILTVVYVYAVAQYHID